jgi:hypothetical protein
VGDEDLIKPTYIQGSQVFINAVEYVPVGSASSVATTGTSALTVGNSTRITDIQGSSVTINGSAIPNPASSANFGTSSPSATVFGSSSQATTVSGSSITLAGATSVGGALNLNNNSLQNAQIQTSSFTTAPTANPTATHTLNTGTGFPLTMIIALGSESGIPSASTTSAVASFRAPYAMKLYGVRAGYNGDNDAVSCL